MTKQFTYFQSIVEYRVESKEDGSLGSPEIMNKWTKEKGAPKFKKPKPKAKPVVKKLSIEVGEVVY